MGVYMWYNAWRKEDAMKKNFGKKNWLFPMPVLMIGTYCNYERG